MKTKCSFCAMAAIAAVWTMSATEFPLQFKPLTAEATLAFPGGYGALGMLSPTRPAPLKKEPPANSKHPIYGTLGASTNGYSFRIDESKGDGQGYDRLLIDLNQNGDLTDDAAAAPADLPKSTAPAAPTTGGRQTVTFGPIPVPDNKRIGDWRPLYFAQLFLYTRPSTALASSAYLGNLRLKAGWYLETTAEIGGVRQKVGVYDADSNLRLGDVAKPVTYRSTAVTNWYLNGGDVFLVDRDGSGNFETSIADNETAPFGPVLHVGATPCRVSLPANCQSLSLEPWSGELATLALQPHGDQVQSIQVAWQSASGQWHLLKPALEAGQAKVPPGNYRLYTCTIQTKSTAGETLTLIGTKRTGTDPIKAEAGAPTPFLCGAPLEIQTTSQRDSRVIVDAAPESSSLLSRLSRSITRTEDPTQQRISATVFGAGGETYSSFNLSGPKGARQPPPPTFAITGAGKTIASGNMEFG